MTVAELIERLEKATEPDRLIDAEIAAWKTGGDCYAETDDPGSVRLPGCGSVSSTSIQARRYTASIDAALMLVPEGVHLTLRIPNGSGVRQDGLCGAYIDMDREPWTIGVSARTAPLALCITALKAREAGNG